MNQSLKYLSVGIAGALIAICGFLAYYTFAPSVFGSQSTPQNTTPNRYVGYSFFSATSTNATSTNSTDTTGFDIKGAKHVNLVFSRTGNNGNTGSSIFFVEVSPNGGTTWIPYNRLNQNLASSTAYTTLGSVTLTSTSTALVGLDQQLLGFDRMRCIVVEITDGEHTCSGYADF